MHINEKERYLHEEQWIMMIDKSVMVYCCCYGLGVKPLKAQQLLQAVSNNHLQYTCNIVQHIKTTISSTIVHIKC